MNAPDPNTHTAERDSVRHSQISIRLHYALNNEWHWMEALQWNERGFCFFHTHALQAGALAFKRSLQHFAGEVVWTRACQDEAQVLEMLLNEAIHQQAEKLQSQAETRQRLLNLMRVQGMADAKQRVLSALGGPTTAERWRVRVQQRMRESLFQSGVRVDSVVWNTVVADAMSLGSVVQDLERWSGAMGGS